MITNSSKVKLWGGGSRGVIAALLVRSAIAGSAILSGGQAFAQVENEAGAQVGGEIIVTAQRREQAVIDVPIAISVLGGETIEDLNLSNFTSIAQQTPNFNITFDRGGNATPDLSIRGVRGDGATSRVNESSVAIYVDEVYLGDEASLAGQMFDVERVEVLRGPQGTLFGRNTTGGLVHFVSASPTFDPTGKVSVLYGSDDWVSLNGAVSGPLGENIRTRLAGQFERHDGHFTNRATLAGVPKKLAAKQVWSMRSTTDIDIGSTTTLRLQVTHSETDSESTPNYGLGIWQDATQTLCSRKAILAAECVDAIVLSGEPPQNGRRAGDAITELSREELAINQSLTSLTAKLETDLGGVSLISLANYTRFKSRIGVDGDAASTPSTFGLRVFVPLRSDTEQFNGELRLQGQSDALDWVAGLFYYQDRKKASASLNIRNNAGDNLVHLPSSGRVDTKSGAAFGQIDWHFTDRLTLTVGARYTIENRELVEASLNEVLDIRAAVADSDPVTKDVTGRVSLAWEPSPDHTLYASYSRGAKSVAYNVFYTPASLDALAALTGPVGQEHLDAFEIGSKNRFFNQTLMFNLTGFYYFFDGKQELLTIADTSGSTPVLTTQFLNIGKAEMYGAEVELNYAPNERWDIALSGGLLDTEITNSPIVFQSPRLGLVPLQGRPIPQTPKWNVSATLAHHIPVSGAGVFTLQAEGRAQAKQNFGLSNDPLADVPSYGLVNLRILWESDDKKYNAQAFVTNVFNKAYFNYITDANVAAGSLITLQAEPRLWGIKFGVAF